MVLSHHRESLSRLTLLQFKKAILERRSVIRWHRDQKGDDRCWLDDFCVWAMLSGTPGYPEKISCEEGMPKCELFFEYRGLPFDSPAPVQAPPINRELWDEDLDKMTLSMLIEELFKIQQAIYKHCFIVGRERTLRDDQDLYDVLPEKISADFRLPLEEDFLGRARAPMAGCPAFFESHEDCATSTCNFQQWGPCKKKRKVRS